MKKTILFSILAVLLTVMVGCNGSKEEANDKNDKKMASSPYERTEFLMGTVVNIKIYDEGKQDVLDPVFERINWLADHTTINETEDENSEIALINEKAGVEPVTVSDDIYELIKAGLDYSMKAEGSYDITIGPLTNMWKIGYPDARKPEQSEIDAVLPLINYKEIELDEANKTVFLKKSGMQLDLGSIAKGFIADETVEVLKEHGVTSAIVDLGGNIIVVGNSPSGNKWNVGIQEPDADAARGAVVGKIQESDRSIVTSGIYERVLNIDGESYHHLLDPKTGYPFNNDIAGVTIVSDQSIDGDGLSTSVFSKGIEGGLQFIEQFEGAEAIFISHDKKVYLTSGIKDNFELTNEEYEIVN
ncbi:FAD:protein FMN transferase [Niallia sp. XMNu-256]|uniref:FAD:protein FMN transferase n=1 Tax=Niallia sp. XMNu-256 TaxID=3082444 RepID=UPI0030D26215